MSTYTVNMNQIEYVVGEMSAISQKIQAALGELDDSAKIHLSEWTSDARSTYDVAKAKWDTAAADMVTQANNATLSLGHINESYHAGERQGVSLWDQ
ncbi:WXG100 family type VII secretion target [Streptomyces sp. NPDC051642]|uniref:WXG100 family type VII secretion target n=1 Tax=unclassified Streptomyces TaxID=2593676 RepID=UPI00343FFD7C